MYVMATDATILKTFHFSDIVGVMKIMQFVLPNTNTTITTTTPTTVTTTTSTTASITTTTSISPSREERPGPLPSGGGGAGAIDPTQKLVKTVELSSFAVSDPFRT